MREKIAIETLKQELNEVRKTGKQKVIQSVELKIVNKIMYVLYEYPYQVTENHFWFQPSKIMEHKEIYCTWLCLMAHAFLSELWIEHYGLTIYEHSALEVVIGKKRYYCDVTAWDKLLLMNNIEKVWEIEKVEMKDFEDSTIYFQRNSTEETLLSHICSNIWTKLYNDWKFEQSIKIFQKSLDLNPWDSNTYRYLANSMRELKYYKESEPFFQISIDIHPFEYDTYNNYWVLLNVLKRYEEAIKKFDTAISIHPKDPDWYLNKWKSLFYLEKYPEAISCIQKVIKLNREISEPYNDLGLVYIKMKKMNEAFQAFDTAIRMSPTDSYYYFNKWLAFEEVWKYHLTKLYIFACDAMDKKKKNAYKSPEKQIILDLVQKSDFEWIRQYLLSLEKNSN